MDGKWSVFPASTISLLIFPIRKCPVTIILPLMWLAWTEIHKTIPFLMIMFKRNLKMNQKNLDF